VGYIKLHKNDGDKLVQGILRKIEKVECINVVLELPETKRGSGGFGSTGN
jgi:dUTPase